MKYRKKPITIEALKVVQRCKEWLKEFNSRANKKRV